MEPALVFDIGGVFVKLGGMSRFMSWTGGNSQQVKARWLSSGAVRAFESGRSTFDRFAAGVIEEFGLPITTALLQEEMRTWMTELYEGAHDILSSLAARGEIACLCNLNAIQWPVVRDDLALGRYFHRSYVSHETGLLKPDIEAYIHVARDLGAQPQQIVFFDDSQPNVDGARAAGWIAYRVEGTSELRRKLSSLDLL